MPPQISIASVVFSEVPGASGLFVVDQASGRAYRLSLEEGDPVESGRLMMAIRGQMKDSMVRIPREDIAEVIGTEKRLSEEAARKVAERSADARG